MKPFLYFALSLIVSFLSFNVTAQKQSSPQVTSGLLWEVSGNGLKESSYLFGTYHLVGKDFLDTLPGVVRQLSKVKTVVGEVVMEEDMVMAQKLMPLMLLKDNSLDKILTAAEYAETDAFVKAKTGMNLNVLNALKPAAVQITLIAYLVPKNITAENPALDMYFQTETKKANKQVIGLETVEEQGTILFGISLERQKEQLLKTVRESDRMINEATELFTQYKQQNLQAIEKAFLENDDYTPEEMNTLLVKRNKNWLKKIPSLINNGPTFFAVGAGHLVGDEGLIALLRNEGYTLKPLSMK